MNREKYREGRTKFSVARVMRDAHHLRSNSLDERTGKLLPWNRGFIVVEEGSEK
jgi:hypothetical protein